MFRFAPRGLPADPLSLALLEPSERSSDWAQASGGTELTIADGRAVLDIALNEGDESS